MSDSLSRLRAGLDRDEAIARAAIEATEGPDWYADGLEEDAEDLQRWNVWAEDTIVAGSVAPVAQHSARHDPARALRQAEKLREAADLLDSAVNGSGPEPDLPSVCAELSEILASIYPEEGE